MVAVSLWGEIVNACSSCNLHTELQAGILRLISLFMRKQGCGRVSVSSGLFRFKTDFKKEVRNMSVFLFVTPLCQPFVNQF